MLSNIQNVKHFSVEALDKFCENTFAEYEYDTEKREILLRGTCFPAMFPEILCSGVDCTIMFGSVPMEKLYELDLSKVMEQQVNIRTVIVSGYECNEVWDFESLVGKLYPLLENENTALNRIICNVKKVHNVKFLTGI